MKEKGLSPHFLRKVKATAVSSALMAGRYILSSVGGSFTVDEKQKHDFVTEVDRKAETIIIEKIRSAFPDHDILAEESGLHRQTSDFRWIIDPLDGTTNFIHGFPFFCVSIALEISGKITIGVVFEPVRKELFSAVAGHGAFLNGRPIRISACGSPSQALLATGFPYRDYRMMDDYMHLFEYFMKNSAGVRRPGSAAMDLCYLACGRIEGFWELYLNPWDVAAGSLIIQEAGGTITDFSGGMNYLYHGNILGSNGKIHSWMLEAAKKYFEDRLSGIKNHNFLATSLENDV